MTEQKSEVEALYERAQRGLLEPKLLDIRDPKDPGLTCQVLLVPHVNGTFQTVQAQSVKEHLDKYRPTPERILGTARLGDLESYIAHTNRFKTSGSSIFADPGVFSEMKPPTLTTVFDYHVDAAQPRFGQHRAEYAFPLSDEWNAWVGSHEKVFTQDRFAAFVEDHLLDVLPLESVGETAAIYAQSLLVALASPAKLRELSEGLLIRSEQTLSQVIRQSSGECNFIFKDVHTDDTGQPLRVPGAFVIGIPVFRNGETYQICVRLRYRKKESRLEWFFELYKHDAVFAFAFRDACEKAQKETSLPLFIGKPEA